MILCMTMEEGASPYVKDVIPTASQDELLDLLSSNGMLVKRPIVVADDFILSGFKEKEWKEKLK